MIGQQQLFGAAVEEVYQHQVKTMWRKMEDRIPADIGSLRIVERGEFMADINEVESGVDIQQLTFHCRYQVVLMTYI